MNAHQRRVKNRAEDRYWAGVVREMDARDARKAAMVEADRAAMKPVLEQMFRDGLPPELQQYAPSVEWR